MFEKVTRTNLQGHTDEVLCVEAPSFKSSHCLLSGSADGTARLWDLRDNGNIGSCNCFCVPNRTPVNFLHCFKISST